MSVYEVLSQAILNMKPCVISKPGEPERSICPYRLGRSSKGDINVIYYQFAGYTSHPGGLEPDGASANWRCNHVADLDTAEIIDGDWHEPLVKPKTRGYCVVVDDFAVNY
jgi:hypothetical protein